METPAYIARHVTVQTLNFFWSEINGNVKRASPAMLEIYPSLLTSSEVKLMETVFATVSQAEFAALNFFWSEINGNMICATQAHYVTVS